MTSEPVRLKEAPRSTFHQWPVLPLAADQRVELLPSLPLAAGLADCELSALAALPCARFTAPPGVAVRVGVAVGPVGVLVRVGVCEGVGVAEPPVGFGTLASVM